jgi:selenocysteine-specific elongation factor
VAGFGTVVTGTLIDGSLHVGDDVIILPQNLPARIRGLQTHKTKIDQAVPGSRVAINLSGVELADVPRGSTITRPGWLTSTVLIDTQFEYLADAPRPLTHNTEVKFFYGAAEVPAHIRLLNDDALAPGQTGWVQFAMREPLPLVKGDRFIVRLPSPSITLGGGVVIDPQPGRRHRRFKPEVVARLETLAKGTPSELLLKALEASGPISSIDLFKRTSLPKDEAAAAVQELLDTQQALPLKADLFIAASGWATLRHKMFNELSAYHVANPLKIGMPREELKSRLGLETKTFNLIIDEALQKNVVAMTGATLHRPDFHITFKPEQQKAIEALIRKFQAAPWNTPSPKESEQIVGAQVLAALIDLGQLLKLSEDVLLLPETYADGVEKIRAHLIAQKTITVAQVRDLFTTSRKYALALMEYLDAQGVTKRQGDERVLK